MRLADFSVLTFDCYGTLIDWETGMTRALAPLVARAAAAGLALDRDQVLQAHARHESRLQLAHPTLRYCALLERVHAGLAQEWGVEPGAEEGHRYGQSVGDWPAFPDSAEALAYLSRHYALVVLSNVDNASFARSQARLGVDFDAVCTAEDIGAYKPSPRNFEVLLEVLAQRGHARERVLHVAESLFHDHVPANAAGLASCWIHRRHAQPGFGATMAPQVQPRIDLRFESMADLAQAHRAQAAAG